MIGTLLDRRYRILARLGEGGMGEVWLAEHVNLGRKEALKVLHPALAQDPQFVWRLRREARALNRLQHPNIVSVHDFGRLQDGRYYLSLEYAEGERLDEVVRKQGPLPISRVVAILAQLADAVDHAHSRGVVHRDLKPSNLVLINHRGRADVIKVLDFGIAKIIAPEYDESVRLTRRGEVFGTAAYMSPEQLQGIGNEPRSDIYAIGCIAWELLVGEPPFLGKTMDVMNAHLSRAPDSPRARRRAGDVPVELDDLILRCLEKEPDRRFQGGRELGVALAEVPGYRPHRTSSGRRLRITPPADDYQNPEDTESQTDEYRFTDPDAGTRATELLEPDAADDGLRELAEALLDAGAKDYQLILGVTDLRELEKQRAGHALQMQALEARAETMEKLAQEREAGLRFALGELAEIASPEADAQARRIEMRLATVARDLEKDLDGITREAIALAATRARTEEQIRQLLGSLDLLVEELLPRFGNEPAIAPLVSQRRTRPR
jgi:hypothetical protein